MNKPLNAYLVYDKDLEKKEQYYELFYKLLCRNKDKPSAQSINIPIYVLTNTNDKVVCLPKDECKKKIIFLLVDVNMLHNQKSWKKFFDTMKKYMEKENSSVQCLPIALTKLALDDPAIGGKDFIYLNDYLKEDRKKFEIRICHFCLRALLKKERLKVFISHSKRDSDKRGLRVAEFFREKIAADTKLEFYFDANNIQDGENFEKSIERDARRSLLLLLNSDSYSSREWCQREIIAARKRNCPYIIVSLINNISERIFPYMGNVPCIRYNDNWEEVLLLLLKTATWNIYGKKYLECVKRDLKGNKSYGNIATVMGVPDLFSVVGVNKKTILYSLPPLMLSERSLLKNKFKGTKFITPTEVHSLNLKGKKIAFSVSESKDAEEFFCNKYLYDDLIVEIAKYILVNKGHVIYGGDLRRGGHTENFLELIYSYKENDKGAAKHFAVTNYLTEDLKEEVSKEDDVRYKQNGINLEFVPVKKKLYKTDESGYKSLQLSSMRKKRNDQTDILIAAGGKIQGSKGILPGILEEVVLAMDSNKPIYLLGGFGGMTNRIVKLHTKEITIHQFKMELFKDENYALFLNKINQLNNNKFDLDKICKKIIDYKKFNTGLESEEKNVIATSHDVLDVINLLMKGLKNGYKA